MSLIEVTIAGGLIALVTALSLQGMASSQRTSAVARATTQATAIARGALESAQSLGWANLVHPDGQLDTDPNVSFGMFDPDGSGPLSEEPLVEEPGGGLDPYAESVTQNGLTFTARTYVTSAASATKRLSVLVSWSLRGRPRTTTMSTLIHPPSIVAGAAAHIVDGEIAGIVAGPVGAVSVGSSGGTETQTATNFSPVPGLTGSGGVATATVDPAVPSARAQASATSISLALPGISISASGVVSQAESVPGSISASATGTVTVNGTPYLNPAPGTVVTIGSWRVVLNDQRLEADGSRSVAFLRLEGGGDEITVCLAWVAPAEVLGA